MARITADLLRRRAEHNDRNLITLHEIALHAQGIERIELLGSLCRHLRILLLQNNLISRIEGLHRLKELEHLNLALNNITRLANLQRCESLRVLDLTANFVPPAGLLGLRAALGDLPALRELHLLGNPCASWPGYRAFVVGSLPRLQRLDGEQVLPSSRIAAAQQLPALEARLRAELAAQGLDPDEAAQAEDDSLAPGAEVEETGVVGDDGQLRRPWCPATRVLEQREAEAEEAAAEARRRAAQPKAGDGLFGEVVEPPPRTVFPEIVDGAPVYQKNEGKWEYSLAESADGRSVQLDVAFDRYLDTSAIQADVQPRVVRLLCKGRLLQLELPSEVAPDRSVAQRSKTTGHLLLTMPLAEGPSACLRPVRAGVENAAGAGNRSSAGGGSGSGGKRSGAAALAAPAELPPALVVAAAAAAGGGGALGDDDDDLPPL
ncbi:tilB-like protein [Micractinium conductrix]|uniref:TilB-like protein n=1 Tax=Micractinium conductrix TaxID=554055 RepID=A0A2P6V7V3_9CHLO|nr:tilB-like protein [Micractinium conductrix]|eukprot:PSC70165.1 tilB-like protein [Micractinium conductrix]